MNTDKQGLIIPIFSAKAEKQNLRLSGKICVLLFLFHFMPQSAFPIPKPSNSVFRIPTSEVKRDTCSTPHRSPPWIPCRDPPDRQVCRRSGTVCSPAGFFCRSVFRRKRSLREFWVRGFEGQIAFRHHARRNHLLFLIRFEGSRRSPASRHQPV
jgi:hypothetical protein